MTAPLADLEVVAGLEVHCQLRTESKAFCSCPTRFGDAPNTQVCPTCAGLPGALPVFNARAVELALRLAVALGCRVRPRSIFARKNYFYPDLPKGYQISQHDEPLAEGGEVVVELPGGRSMRIALTRLHLEEDAGKSLHEASETTSFVDLNRSGVPLVEIVSAPDFRAADEVHAYLVSLRQLVRYLGVSDGNMDQGSLRCDCNVSVRPRGSRALGTKVELKNLNSFRSVTRALEHEAQRQSEVLRAGGTIEQGTRLWDDARGITLPMRRKEDAHDYRYFPDPDLPPLLVSPAMLEQARAGLPELPAARRRRFTAEWGLTDYEAGVLTAAKAVADFFEEVAAACGDPKAASNWVQGEILRELKERAVDLEQEPLPLPVSAGQLAGLIGLVHSGALSVTAARRALAALAGTSRRPEDVVDELGLRQVTDDAPLRAAVAATLAAHPQAVADFRAGQDRAFGFLVGQAMRATAGKGAPARVNAILREELERMQ